MTAPLMAARQRHVELLVRKFFLHVANAELVFLLFQQRLNLPARLVDDLPDAGSFFLRQFLQSAQKRRELALLPQKFHADVVQRSHRIRMLLNLLRRQPFQLCDLFLHNCLLNGNHVSEMIVKFSHIVLFYYEPGKNANRKKSGVRR